MSNNHLFKKVSNYLFTKQARRDDSPITEDAMLAYNKAYLNNISRYRPNWFGFIPFMSIVDPCRTAQHAANRHLASRAGELAVAGMPPTEVDNEAVKKLLKQYQENPQDLDSLKEDRDSYRDVVYTALRQYRENKATKSDDTSANDLLKLLYDVPKEASFTKKAEDNKDPYDYDYGYILPKLYNNSAWLSSYEPYSLEEARSLDRKAYDDPTYFQKEHALREALKRFNKDLYWKTKPDFDLGRVLRSYQKSGKIPRADRGEYTAIMQDLAIASYLGKLGFSSRQGVDLDLVPGTNDTWKFRRPIKGLLESDYPTLKSIPYSIPSSEDISQKYKALKLLAKQRLQEEKQRKRDEYYKQREERHNKS